MTEGQRRQTGNGETDERGGNAEQNRYADTVQEVPAEWHRRHKQGGQHMAVPFIEKQEANNHTGRYGAFQHEGAHDEWVVGREIEAKMLLERGSDDWHTAANSERLDDGYEWQPEQK